MKLNNHIFFNAAGIRKIELQYVRQRAKMCIVCREGIRMV